jgi:predicted glycosyltransferase
MKTGLGNVKVVAVVASALTFTELGFNVTSLKGKIVVEGYPFTTSLNLNYRNWNSIIF